MSGVSKSVLSRLLNRWAWLEKPSKTATSASAYLRSGKVLIQANLPTTTGLMIASGPVHTAPHDNPDAVGEALRAALSLPYDTLPHPHQDKWPSVQTPMLAAAGVRSWKTLAKGSKAVGVTLNGADLQLTPTTHYDQAGGTALEEDTVRCELAHSKLGAALLEAFARCQ
ncbi:hypothetical protein [Rhizobium sp. SYY.PMSO]|uniref:hypothetical protein n=1 Tax=Rhizobium sp. SYY.PMSO TaxID=3382192 RepID=UPI00398FF7F1